MDGWVRGSAGEARTRQAEAEAEAEWERIREAAAAVLRARNDRMRCVRLAQQEKGRGRLWVPLAVEGLARPAAVRNCHSGTGRNRRRCRLVVAVQVEQREEVVVV